MTPYWTLRHKRIQDLPKAGCEPWPACRALAYNGGLGVEPTMGFKAIAHGGGQGDEDP